MTAITHRRDKKDLIIEWAEALLFALAIFSLFMSFKFFIFVFFAFLIVIKNKNQVVYMARNLIIPISLIIVMIIYSVCIGNDIKYPLMEGRDIIITVVTLIMMNSICIKSKKPSFVISMITIFACAVSVVKALILAYSIKTGVSASTIVYAISDITGWQLMTYDLSDSFISRIQFPIDLVSCFLIYFSMNNALRNVNFKNISIVSLLVFSVLVTMSRTFWFISLIMILLSFTHNIKKKSSFISILLVLFSIFTTYALTFDATNKIIESRLGSDRNASSDDVRGFQYRVLTPKFLDSPMLGHGLGYFIPEYSEGGGNNNYAYESQVLAMFTKLGIIGFASLIVYFFYICFSFNRAGGLRTFYTKLIFFSLWIFSGAVNPLLFSVPGGIVLFLTSNAAVGKDNDGNA